ncbi:YheC/YheD family protein [Oceanobacillus jeddahense]|uniref:YheC/YheD family protein n=1 Tax=Oceanobacillus jeddahense TaxID=1462527 RepID=A0ABY5JTQ3_9BACI|nr:YheC/YheD family protein [Oceanobacillus jeddahense]UUI02558.1 YheC/YheD family protein [Oceanobacillus jeddahense]
MQEIGMLTNFNQPTELAKMTSLVAKAYGMELIFMRPRDINIEEKKVYGKVLVNNKWVVKKTDIPPFIDAAPYCFTRKNKERMDFLRKTTFLSDNRRNVVTKEMLQNTLSKDEQFSHLMIPTHKIKTFKDMDNYLHDYQKVVLKPSGGMRGRGIYIIENKDNDLFTIGFNKNKWDADLNALEEFFDNTVKGKNYILQKYVTSITPQGDPFDCRVHVEKDGTGKWAVAKIYVRIGIGQSVISNVNQGGGISDPEEFLKANFNGQQEEIYQNLLKLGTQISEKMEQLRGTHIMSLGLDIGIDTNGKLYLFEVNDGPSTKAVISEVAFLRSNYYLYVLEKHLNRKVKDSMDELENKQKEIHELKEIIAEKEEQLNNILNSKSWKVTGIMRKARRKMTKKK